LPRAGIRDVIEHGIVGDEAVEEDKNEEDAQEKDERGFDSGIDDKLTTGSIDDG
jgi:hypothetical protein